jgi:Tol biopolymer transport system component
MGIRSGVKWIALLACSATFVLACAAAEATFPGKNGKITFVGAPPGLGPFEIHIVNPDGTARMRLLPDAGAFNDSAPKWSADGQRLAFTRHTRGSQYIATSNADGTGLKVLPLEGATPNWSPDGRKLAYAWNRDIWVANQDGSDPLRLTGSQREEGGPSWSPDGRRIAFVSSRDGNWEIYVMDADGRNQTRITQYPGFDSQPDWSPDGRRILFLRQRPSPGGTDLMVMDPDGTDATVLANAALGYRTPVWSPDGTKIAVSPLCCGGRGQLQIMNANGTSPVQLGTEFGADPTWQPVPGPRRSDFKNGPAFCRAEREFWGEAFAGRYGGGANAFGKCVSSG